MAVSAAAATTLVLPPFLFTKRLLRKTNNAEFLPSGEFFQA